MKKYTLKTLPDDRLHLIQPSNLRIQYKQELNPAQFEAVTSVNGPHLIIAGAGTGKTRTIVYRVAYLVELGVRPDAILLLTFTRKAAQEMLRKASIALDRRGASRSQAGHFIRLPTASCANIRSMQDSNGILQFSIKRMQKT